jgi:hypothetical protein
MFTIQDVTPIFFGRDEPERPLATLTHAGNPDGHDQSMAQGLLSVTKICGLTSITRLRLGSFWEPPSADPHARWCGEGERKTPPYPFGRYSFRFRVQSGLRARPLTSLYEARM